MSNKRIVIFSWAESVHLIRWAEGLSARGHEIKVISLGGQPLDTIETVIFPRNSKLSYFAHSGLAAQEAKKYDPDLVHVHYAGGFGIWGMASKIRPMVVSVWGSDITELTKNWFNRVIVKRTLQRADKITATSNYLKERTSKLVPKETDHIDVIPFGVNCTDRRLPLPPPDPFKLCFLKGHLPIYGPEILLKAVAEVKKQVPAVQLSMAGNGPITSQLKELVSRYELEQNVEFVGFIDNQEVPAFIGKHHLMVMPSLQESFGVAVLEAAVCGRSTVATRVGGIPEVIQDGVTGLLVSPGSHLELAEAIIRLYTDQKLLAQMGDAAYSFVKKTYDWDQSLDMMEKLYDRVLYEKTK